MVILVSTVSEYVNASTGTPMVDDAPLDAPSGKLRIGPGWMSAIADIRIIKGLAREQQSERESARTCIRMQQHL